MTITKEQAAMAACVLAANAAITVALVRAEHPEATWNPTLQDSGTGTLIPVTGLACEADIHDAGTLRDGDVAIVRDKHPRMAAAPTSLAVTTKDLVCLTARVMRQSDADDKGNGVVRIEQSVFPKCAPTAAGALAIERCFVSRVFVVDFTKPVDCTSESQWETSRNGWRLWGPK